MGRDASAVLEIGQPVGLVQAAGGMIVRRPDDGDFEVVIVHRPIREDWSFPKGKREPGESFEDCAVREVYEETGLKCRLGRFVGHTEYRDRKDRPKVVAYWVMEVESGEFLANDEVDGMRWVTPSSAARLLSYDRDRELLNALVAAVEEGAAFDEFDDDTTGGDFALSA